MFRFINHRKWRIVKICRIYLNSLHYYLAEKLTGSVPEEVEKLLEAILPEWDNKVLAVLFYGSCLRTNVFINNVADFYLIVEDLGNNKNSFITFLNKLLPPNVYYIETPYNESILRAKYGIFTFNQFKKMASMDAFHPYLWARLVQPMRIVYLKDENIKIEIVKSIYSAITTLMINVAPQLKNEFNLKQFWIKALKLTYKTEIRPEGKSNILNIYNSNSDYLNEIAKNILEILPYPIQKKEKNEICQYNILIGNSVKCANAFSWALKIVLGKLLSAVRLLKSLLTFENALEYGYYKLSKHTPNVIIPSMFRNNLFFSCLYLFLIGIKRKIFK